MNFKLPDREELKTVAADLGRSLDDGAAEALLGYMQAFELGFQYIEQEVAKQGKILKETPLDELERYWQDAKTKAK